MTPVLLFHLFDPLIFGLDILLKTCLASVDFLKLFRNAVDFL